VSLLTKAYAAFVGESPAPGRLELGTHTEFSEPPVCINTDFLNAERLGWSESQAWDEFVAFYAPSFGGGV
jgi:hypothetical protein